jgi:hypothetical protein
MGWWTTSFRVLGRGEPALWHARRCVEIYEANGIGDWDIASGYEAMARANAVAGDLPAARKWKTTAVAACARIADADERQQIEQDLATLSV